MALSSVVDAFPRCLCTGVVDDRESDETLVAADDEGAPVSIVGGNVGCVRRLLLPLSGNTARVRVELSVVLVSPVLVVGAGPLPGTVASDPTPPLPPFDPPCAAWDESVAAKRGLLLPSLPPSTPEPERSPDGKPPKAFTGSVALLPAGSAAARLNTSPPCCGVCRGTAGTVPL